MIFRSAVKNNGTLPVLLSVTSPVVRIATAADALPGPGCVCWDGVEAQEQQIAVQSLRQSKRSKR